MGDGTVADISDDLHVRMRMGWEPGVRRDLIVVPHTKGTPVHALRVVVARKREMMLGLEPTVVGSAKGSKRSYLDYVVASCAMTALLHAVEIGSKIGPLKGN